MAFADAGVPYHQQDDDRWCGAAAAQMVLDALGMALPPQCDLIKSELYDARINGTPPANLRRALNALRPATCRAFKAHCDRDKRRGIERIAAAVLAGQGGVPVMVHGNAHWVVVTGVSLDDTAESGAARIKGFFLNNPEPQTAYCAAPNDTTIKRPPPCHQVGDHCGDGIRYGSANTYVTRYDWEHSMWDQPNTVLGQRGYFSVSNGPAVASRPVSADASPGVEPRPAVSEQPNDDVIRGWAAAGIREHRLARGGPLAARIAGCQLGAVDEGVDCVDDGGATIGCFRQVRLMRDGHQVGSASVEPRSGEFLGVQAPPTNTVSALAATVLAALQQHAEELSDLLNQAGLEQRSFQIRPAYVWKPCLESMSRYSPFAQVNVAGSVVYVGMDGRVHRELTPHDRT